MTFAITVLGFVLGILARNLFDRWRDNREFNKELDAMSIRHSRETEQLVKSCLMTVCEYQSTNPPFKPGTEDWIWGLILFMRSKNRIEKESVPK